LALTSVSAALLKWVSDVALLRIEGQVAAQLQAGVIDRLLRLPSRFFNAYSSADLAQRTLAIENLRKAVTGVVLSAVMASISLVPQLILMFWYSPGVASVGLGVMLLYLAVAAWAGYRQLRAIYEGEAITANITNVTLQLIQGVTKLRLAGAEQRAFAHWAHLFADMRLRSLRSQRIAHRFALFQGAFDFVSLGMAFALVALLSQTQLNTGEFLAFLSTYGLSLRATQQMGGALMQVLNVKPLVERIEPLLGAPVEVDERKLNPGTLSGYVEVMNLAFRYGPGQPRVLNGLSLSVRPGQFVALVGASGCGKSTLLKLLLGFEQPEVGGVFLDGKDLRTLDLQAVRRQIGVVLQSGKIMPGSLFDNIRGATNITLDEAWEAARQAGLEADIRAMPMQMHTVLTEGTASLSGGQAQRLLIARALAGKPRLLIFDEATSALDNKTQAQVTQSLSSLAVTRIAIAHRLSTVMDADCIHVIDNGKVIESGTYSQLMALEGHFHRLVTRQVI
jgi:NHLM bacteriocin system ABC transporter ATP-binding protein